jgi:hypothetical protein
MTSNINIATKMRAERSSETSVNFYQTTRLNIPENSKIYRRRGVNAVSLNTIAVRALSLYRAQYRASQSSHEHSCYILSRSVVHVST